MNNIVIGLGGTGGKIINKLKHKLYKKADIPVEYLYIDSNFDLVDRDEYLWKAFGNDISLGENNKYRLTADHLSGAFDFQHQQITPRYSSWGGDIENWKDIGVHLADNAAIFGNQRRRLGRMLLAGHIDNILNRVNFLVQSLQKKTGNNNNTFHICAGLSGGTGSGSFIDILAKLKESYGSNSKFILYLFLPEDNPDSRRLNGGNYFANAYSALKELNALYTNNWTPYDISNLNKKISLNNNTSFLSTTYVITNSNESNCLLDVENMQPEEMVADFISLRLTNGGYGGSLSGTENAGARQAENENGKHVRSREFFSFGIKRVIYPKEEISQYMIYNIIHKISLALRFNQWSEQSGYIESTNIQNISILTDSRLKEFSLTPEYLLLSSGILENENRWKNFEDEWSHYIASYTKNAKEKRGLKEKDIAQELFLSCAKRYTDQYRGLGVAEFFRDAKTQINTRSRYISNNIQSYLISSWLKGEMSLPQIDMVIDEIIRLLSKRKEKFTEEHNALDRKIEESRAEISTWKNKLENTWLFSKKEYNNTLNALREHYIYRTYNEAYTYSDVFIDVFINDVQGFQKNYNSLVATFKEFSDDLEKDYSVRLVTESNDTIEKIYDKELIDTLLNSTILNNKEKMDLFKSSVENLIDNQKDFVSLSKKFANKDFKFKVESIINDELHNVIHSIATTQPQFDIANKNIIQEIENKYGNDEQGLKRYMEKLIADSKFYLPFDHVELQEVVDNDRIQEHNPSAGIVLYPDIDKDSPFKESILRNLNRQNQTQSPRGDGLMNELTILDIQPTFPLRYIGKLKRLESEYNERYENNDRGEIDVKIHLEGTKNDYSSPLLPSLGNLQEQSIYKLFILNAFELILENKQFGLHIEKYSGDRIVGNINLGESFIIAHRALKSVDDNMSLEGILSKKLSKLKTLDYQEKEEQKKILIERINSKYKEIEAYYRERDVSKIPFWGEKASISIKVIEEI